MKVRFWGTRGSIATPGPSTLKYGGNTSCIEVRSDSGALILIDCGTGAHALGRVLVEREKPCSGHILISHTHWDHIQGLPFFAPLFTAGNEWQIYGPRGLGQSLREVLAGQMEYAYFPVALNAFAATVHFHEVVEGGFSIGDVRITTHYLNHPALTVGYRIEADGAALVYASDHEPHSAQAAHGKAEGIESGDIAHLEFLRDADLVIHDAQYTAEEYPDKIGWGHSTIEYAVDMAVKANVRRLALFHHDPGRDDEMLDGVIAGARKRAADVGSALVVFGAAEGGDLELRGEAAGKLGPFLPSSLAKIADDLSGQLVLMAGVPAEERAILEEAAKADAVPSVAKSTLDDVRDEIRSGRPSLVFIGEALPGGDPVEHCKALRAMLSEEAKETPFIIVADQAGFSAEKSEAAGATGWLTRPFSVQYARSRMRAWLMRSMFRWRKAVLPEDEERRLQAVHDLALLDTAPEERFDRHARIAAAAL
ncbi:MAG TPA: MBL fold metallo-hydrolase, partial [Sinorhizobium sp.]|nr:MBL fold metallo-hydrolase [Sinorhizobium sp.]